MAGKLAWHWCSDAASLRPGEKSAPDFRGYGAWPQAVRSLRRNLRHTGLGVMLLARLVLREQSLSLSLSYTLEGYCYQMLPIIENIH